MRDTPLLSQRSHPFPKPPAPDRLGPLLWPAAERRGSHPSVAAWLEARAQGVEAKGAGALELAGLLD